MVSQKQRRTVPDFIRRGLRQGLGVGALVAAGYEFVEPFEGILLIPQFRTFKVHDITLLVDLMLSSLQ